MSSTSETPSSEDRRSLRTGIINRFVQIVIFFILQAVILFAAAGQLEWTWAWVFLGISTVSLIVNATFLLRKSPETIAERGEAKLTKKWDKIVSGFYGLFLFILVPLVSGLDTRLGWTGELSITWHLAGAVALAAGLGLAGWAMVANAYFSTTVRIQTDRGHTVCRSGPYRVVRHPGYVGFFLQSFATPLLLGSLFAVIFGALGATALVIRTVFEDRTLQAELPGYQEYAREVRYKLVPWIW